MQFKAYENIFGRDESKIGLEMCAIRKLSWRKKI